MRKKSIALLPLVVIGLGTGFGALAACSKGGTETKDETAPVITLASECPTSGLNGRDVTIPAATATDDVDGDVSSKVKVTVANLKEDGSIRKELIYQETATSPRTFNPSGNFPNYSIVYEVKDSSGNLGKLAVAFVAESDSEAPVLALDTTNFENFNLETGLTGFAATEDIRIPKATAVDMPGSVDVTQNITVTVINKQTGEYAETFYDISALDSFRLLKGEYTVRYTCKDGAGNASNVIEFPLIVDKLSNGGNLVFDEKNFAQGYNVNVNRYGELEIGLTPNSTQQNINCSCATFAAAKIQNEIVALRIRADAPASAGGESFYDFAFRGSKNYNYSKPTGKEGEWAPYLIWRVEQSGIKIGAKSLTMKPPTYTQQYRGTLLDGNEHTVYLQIINEGENAQAEGAKIIMRMWIDVLPTEAPSMEGYYVAGAEDANGVIDQTTFEELWNAYGWCSVSSISSSKDSYGAYAADKMILKGFAVYEADETEFNEDIVAPALTFDNLPEDKYNIGEDVTFPLPTAMDGETDLTDRVSVYLVDEAGTETKLTDGAFRTEEVGRYTLRYEVLDEVGNAQYMSFDIRFIQEDNEQPVITVDLTDLTATVGEEFDIPVYSAQDNVDGDLTASVIVSLEGPQKEAYVNYGGKNYLTIFAEGEHYLVYRVTDLADNETVQRVKVTVTGGKTGNVLVTDSESVTGIDPETKTVTIGREKYTTYQGQFIYDKKVSMIVSAANDKVFMIHVRGDLNNNGIWCQGMTLAFTDTSIMLSLNGYGGHVVASCNSNPLTKSWYQNVNVKISFQTTSETVEGVEYLVFKLWLNDEQIVMKASGDKSVTDAEGTVRIAVDSIPADYRGVLGAGYFFVGCQEQNLTLKELRIDGTDCELAFDEPQIPEGYAVPAAGTEEEVLTEPVRVTAAQMPKILGASNEKQVFVKMTFDDAAIANIYVLQVTAATGGFWDNAGAMFFFYGGNLTFGTGWGNQLLVAGIDMNEGGDFYFAYRLTYIVEYDLVTGVKVEAWKMAEGQYTPVSWGKYGEAPNIDFTDPAAPIVSYKNFNSAQSLVPSNLLAGTNGKEFTVTAASYTEIAYVEQTKYTVTYELDGGTNSASNPTTVLEGKTIRLSDPEKVGYDFIGWYTTSTFDEESKVTELTVTADITVYAKYEESVEPVTVTILNDQHATLASEVLNRDVEMLLTFKDAAIVNLSVIGKMDNAWAVNTALLTFHNYNAWFNLSNWAGWRYYTKDGTAAKAIITNFANGSFKFGYRVSSVGEDAFSFTAWVYDTNGEKQIVVWADNNAEPIEGVALSEDGTAITMTKAALAASNIDVTTVNTYMGVVNAAGSQIEVTNLKLGEAETPVDPVDPDNPDPVDPDPVDPTAVTILNDGNAVLATEALNRDVEMQLAFKDASIVNLAVMGNTTHAWADNTVMVTFFNSNAWFNLGSWSGLRYYTKDGTAAKAIITNFANGSFKFGYRISSVGEDAFSFTAWVYDTNGEKQIVVWADNNAEPIEGLTLSEDGTTFTITKAALASTNIDATTVNTYMCVVNAPGSQVEVTNVTFGEVETPVDPDPVNPDPVDPTDPDPVNPDPVDPTDPDPVNPDPVDPTDPDPVNPDPVDPTDPDPVNPDPADPTDSGTMESEQ